MGVENSDLQKIGENANNQSPNSYINTSVIKLTNNVIIGECKKEAEKDYKKLKIIGEGAFSTVYEAQNRITDIVRAMKVIKKNKMDSNLNEEEEIINEINILKTMDHPNIVKIFEFYSNEEAYSIVMEYCKCGKLFSEIKNFGPFDENKAAYIMYQIFSAINYCQNLNIIHRDLKPENILIVNRNKKYNYPNIKIADFGMSKIVEKKSMQNKLAGTIFYVAPEVFTEKYNEKCDIWSCGIIMYVLLSERIPFTGEDDDEIKNNIIKGEYDLKSPPFDKISDNALDLLKKY